MYLEARSLGGCSAEVNSREQGFCNKMVDFAKECYKVAPLGFKICPSHHSTSSRRDTPIARAQLSTC